MLGVRNRKRETPLSDHAGSIHTRRRRAPAHTGLQPCKYAPNFNRIANLGLHQSPCIQALPRLRSGRETGSEAHHQKRAAHAASLCKPWGHTLIVHLRGLPTRRPAECAQPRPASRASPLGPWRASSAASIHHPVPSLYAAAVVSVPPYPADCTAPSAVSHIHPYAERQLRLQGSHLVQNGAAIPPKRRRQHAPPCRTPAGTAAQIASEIKTPKRRPGNAHIRGPRRQSQVPVPQTGSSFLHQRPWHTAAPLPPPQSRVRRWCVTPPCARGPCFPISDKDQRLDRTGGDLPCPPSQRHATCCPFT